MEAVQSKPQWRWSDVLPALNDSQASPAQLYRGAPLASPPMMLRVPEAIFENLGLGPAQSHLVDQLECDVLNADGGLVSPQPQSEPRVLEESPSSALSEPAPEPMQSPQDTESRFDVCESTVSNASPLCDIPCKPVALVVEEASAAVCQEPVMQDDACVEDSPSFDQQAPLSLHVAQARCADSTKTKESAQDASAELRHSKHPKSNTPSHKVPSRLSRSPQPANHLSARKPGANNKLSNRSSIAHSSVVTHIKSSVATPSRQRACRAVAKFPEPVDIETVVNLQGKNQNAISPANVSPPKQGGSPVNAPSNRSCQPTLRVPMRKSSCVPPACLSAVSSTPSNQAPLRSSMQSFRSKAGAGPLSPKPPLPRPGSKSPPPQTRGVIIPECRQSSKSPGPSRSNTPNRCQPICGPLQPHTPQQTQRPTIPECRQSSRSPSPARSNTPIRCQLNCGPLQSHTPPLQSRRSTIAECRQSSKSAGPSRSNTPIRCQPKCGPTRSHTPRLQTRQSTIPECRQSTKSPGPSPILCQRNCGPSRSHTQPLQNQRLTVHQYRQSSKSPGPSRSSTPSRFQSNGGPSRSHTPPSRSATPVQPMIAECLIEVLNDILTPQPLQAGATAETCPAMDALRDEATTASAALDLAFDKMVLEETIGSGSFGTVWRGTYDGKTVAAKQCVISDEKEQETLNGELLCLRSFSHRRLVSFVGCCSQGSNFFMLMEYMSGGSLYQLLFEKKCKVTFQDQARMACEVCEGLSYLHCLRAIHRDLKTMNIILDASQSCKICDFGLTLVLEKSHRTVRALQGSPRYMAPEQFESKEKVIKVIHSNDDDDEDEDDDGIEYGRLEDVKITNKVDIWGLGCVLLELCCSHIPFKLCTTIQEVATFLVVHRKPPPIPIGADPRVKVIISACHRMCAQMRPTAEALEKAFEKLSA